MRKSAYFVEWEGNLLLDALNHGIDKYQKESDADSAVSMWIRKGYRARKWVAILL